MQSTICCQTLRVTLFNAYSVPQFRRLGSHIWRYCFSGSAVSPGHVYILKNSLCSGTVTFLSLSVYEPFCLTFSKINSFLLSGFLLSGILSNCSGISRFNPWVDQIPQRREWNPLWCSYLEHGQRSLVGYSLWGHRESDMTQRLTLLLLRHILGELIENSPLH